MGLNINVDIDKLIAEAKGSYSKFKDNKTYNRETYDELLEKNAKLIELAELLKSEIEKLKSEELTKDKVETMGAAFELLGNMDTDKIDTIMKLSKKFGDKK